MSDGVARPDDRRTKYAVVMLAVSLILVELLAGMQRYLSQTILPLLAGELDGKGLYGVLDAAAQAPMFLTMPIGAWLLTKFDVSRLLMWLTAVTVVGSIICALAQSMWVFVAGTALRALAAGALSTVSMGAISKGLPPKYRQLVLAGMSGIWLVSSLIGPTYAVAVSSWLDWRWAMVLYLPLLIGARFLISHYLPRADRIGTQRPAPWRWASALAMGSVVLALPAGKWSPLTVCVGVLVMAAALRALLPSRTFRANRGRRAALHALFLTAFGYFGATMVLSVVAHDAFSLTAKQFGFIIAAPGFCWAVTALWTGARPATIGQFRSRAITGGVALATGLAIFAATALSGAGTAATFVGLMAGAIVMGLGMGWMYPDLLGRCLTQPADDDQITTDEMAGHVVLAETVGMSIATTLAYTWLATGFGFIDASLTKTQVLYVVLFPIALLTVYRLAVAGRRCTPAESPAG